MDQEIIRSIQESIKILNDHSGELAVDVAVLKSQMSDIIWWLRAVVGSFIIMIASQFWQVIKMKKNGKNNKG